MNTSHPRFSFSTAHEEGLVHVVRHPSESDRYLVARLLAWALHFEAGLRFSPGVCAGDEPVISLPDQKERLRLWIELNTPSPRKLKKAIRLAERIVISTWKESRTLLKLLATAHRNSSHS